jgi:5-formyltetrahydrofolate cyclo-ligase
VHTRSDIRKRIRSQRRNLSTNERRFAAYLVTKSISNLRVFRASKRVAFYLPNDGELDLSLLIQRAWMMKKVCYLPVLDTLTADQLKFAPYYQNTLMRVNCFGIQEPAVPVCQRVRANALDLVLLPLVAFDARGNRIGMGGGFYDRTLSFLRKRRHWRKPHLLGVAYEFQKIDALNRHKWDVPLQCIVTDKHIYNPKPLSL